jgi:KDO2-lipid IV(A) lauroyltransferase
MKKKIWQRLVYNTFRMLLWVLRFIPWKLAMAWAEMMGSIGYFATSRYRNMAEKNLTIAYGDSLTAAQRKELSKKVFRNFSRIGLVEFLKAPNLTPSQLRTMMKVESFSQADEILARGKGMILITAHFGNWEMMARRAALDGYTFAVVARQSNDEDFNTLTDHLRESGGYIVHPRGGSPRPILKRLREGGIVAILPDQKSDDVFVPFFGTVAGTTAGPAVLSLKTGAGILPMFAIRDTDGNYHVEFLPEIDTHSTGDLAKDSERIMADVTMAIETMVRRYPDHWLWLHDRWKVPPPADFVSKLNINDKTHSIAG